MPSAKPGKQKQKHGYWIEAGTEMDKVKSRYRIMIHIPVGGITVYLLSVSVHLAWIMFIGFMLYELNEDWHREDNAWKDIKGYLWGLALAGIAAAIVGLLF